MRVQVFAVALVTLSCSKGSDPPASTSTDRGAAADEERLVRQCDSGTNAACEELEGVYLKSGRKAQSTALVKRLCEANRRYFCPTFAFVLDLGDGVARDRARARQLFEDTCKDDPKACSEFGNLYLSGTRSVGQDAELGCWLLSKACSYNDQDACRDLQYCK